MLICLPSAAYRAAVPRSRFYIADLRPPPYFLAEFCTPIVRLQQGGVLAKRCFLTAQWRDLLMLNYEADEAVLRPYVPLGTELDLHDGRAYLSVVAFRFLNTRALGIPIPGHRDFEEMNLRFYVRRECAGDIRRAVVFIRELVPCRAAPSPLLHAIYNEPYLALPMRHRVTGVPLTVEYSWYLQDRWQTIAAGAGEPGIIPSAGSHEEFITEHYWGYTRQRDGGTIEHRVEHPQWKVWPANQIRIEADFDALYDPMLAEMLTTPVSAFIAEGSAISVYQPERVPLSRAAA